MQYESDAKVVHGLGIATLVLSILGIVVSLALIVGAGAVTSVATEVLDPEVGVMESIIDSNDDWSELSDDADEFLQLLGEDNVKDIEAIVDSVTVKEINGFGAVVATDDAKKIETALKAIESKYGIDINAKELAKSITNLSPSGVYAIAEELMDMDHSDLNDLRQALSMYDAKYIDGLKGLKDSTVNGQAEQVAVAGLVAVVIAGLVWMIVAYVVSLVAAVLAMRNCRKPDQLTGAFVWSIIAAVLGFFSGHFITMILLIIMCVYIGKVRKFRSELAAGAPAAPAGAAEASPVQPTGAAPLPPQE